VAGRTLSKCEAVAKEIEGRGGTALPVEMDVLTREAVDAGVARVREQLGPA